MKSASSLSSFLKELGSSSPTPGGGAAAALVSATGIALVEMVVRLNDKRLGENTAVAVQAAALRKKTERLIGEDSKAFSVIRRAYKTRKTDKTAWQRALRLGTQAPLRIVENAVSGAKLAATQRSRTSSWLSSDLMEAAILLEASARSASLNVEINLKEMTDRAFVARTRKHLSRLLSSLRREVRSI